MKAAESFSTQEYLDHIHDDGKGVGYWRELYLNIFKHQPFLGWDSIVELGAGTPDFLARAPFRRRVAIDAGTKHQPGFAAANVELRVLDLEKDHFDSLGKFDVAVCSDVFEHLLWPAQALKKIPGILSPRGALISHVPNEYTLYPTLKIMLGAGRGMYFHKDQKEWNDPHIRRFTDIGYREFLQQEFKYNVKITHLKLGRIAGLLKKIKIPAPFCLQGGPTYISTNNEQTYQQVLQAVKDFK